MTSRTSPLAGVLLATMGLAVGCADEPPPYEHADLSLQSPQAREVRALLARLREAGPEGIDTIAREGRIDELPEDQARMLRFTLLQLARAEGVELAGLERFGPKLLQADFETTADGKTSHRLVLLLRTPDGALRWARPN